MELVLAKINFSGSDDVNYEGYVVREVNSLKDWKDQVKASITNRFEEGNGFLEVYHSDNDQTTFESVEELFDKITFRKITTEQYKALDELSLTQFGHVDDFLDYAAPVAKKKNKIK